MITAEQFSELGIAVSSPLNGNAALEWLKKNTTLEFDANDFETVKALPSSAKLFVVKFDEITSTSPVVASESIEGLSQSFNTGDKSDMIWDLANSLLDDCLKGRIKFVSATKRWR